MGYRAKNAPMAHSGLGVQRSPTDGFTTTLEHPKSEGWEGMGPLAAYTQVHERHGHPGPRSSLVRFPIHGFSSKKGKEPLGPVEWTQELYGLTAENLESVTN